VPSSDLLLYEKACLCHGGYEHSPKPLPSKVRIQHAATPGKRQWPKPCRSCACTLHPSRASSFIIYARIFSPLSSGQHLTSAYRLPSRLATPNCEIVQSKIAAKIVDCGHIVFGTNIVRNRLQVQVLPEVYPEYLKFPGTHLSQVNPCQVSTRVSPQVGIRVPDTQRCSELPASSSGSKKKVSYILF
jgi:hypothetical protein